MSTTHYGILIRAEEVIDATIKLVGKRVDIVNGKRWVTLYPDIFIESFNDEVENGPKGETIWVVKDELPYIPYFEVDGSSIQQGDAGLTITAPENVDDDEILKFIMLRRNLVDKGRIPKDSTYGSNDIYT